MEEITQAVLKGNAAGAEAGVRAALKNGARPEAILKDGLIAAMEEVGRRFEAGEYFVPEMLVAARAMKAGIAVLKPALVETGVKPLGKVMLGTVGGDLHDIGKYLVGLMMEGAGFEVIDVGADVAAHAFVEAVRKERPHILGMSALLTTTMPNAEATIQALKQAGLRETVKVMVGGAPITQGYADEIGADGYAPDAPSAAQKAKFLLGL
jgi:5-methyltetrahydrofolate--homocysteine methyltransferase